MADQYTRSYNPIWNFRELTGLPCDDTCWAYFLANEIPYVPQTVYNTSTGTPRSNPVQLSAAGTLSDIFMDPDLVYRIEIRKNDGNLTSPSQSDELVWLIENYVPNGSGGNTPSTVNIAGDNQVTNPQFALVNFESPVTLTNPGSEVEIAPGWVIEFNGSGTAVLNRITLNDSPVTPSNAPYALQLTLSGFTSAILRQRFTETGVLWSDRFISSTFTGLVSGAQEIIQPILKDNEGNLVATFDQAILNSSGYNEFPSVIKAPLSSDTTNPPAAYIDYLIDLPIGNTTTLTSFQLSETSEGVSLTFEQESIERQIDHTFHHYRDSILFQPKDTLLVGWDFPKNPWQFSDTALTAISDKASYITDQTILVTEEADTVSVGAPTDGEGFLHIASRTSTTQGRVALIQYMDPSQVVSVLGNGAYKTLLSSVVEAQIDNQSGNADVKIKMKLIHRTDLPATIDDSHPISGWDSDGPIFASGWTALEPVTDPAYPLTSRLLDYSFNGFEMPAIATATATVGVVLYTEGTLDDSPVDTIKIKQISLMPNEFALSVNPITFDETLRQCQFFYEKSYNYNVLPGTVDEKNAIKVYGSQRVGETTIFMQYGNFELIYKATKRGNATTKFYSPVTGNIDTLRLQINSGTTIHAPTSFKEVSKTNYTLFADGLDRQTYFPTSKTNDPNLSADSSEKLYAFLTFHYTADSRIGV